MKKEQLRTLAKEMEVDPTSPDLIGYLTVLIHTAWPAATEDEVTAIFSKRCEVDVDPLQEIDPEVLDALFPAEDMKIVED